MGCVITGGFAGEAWFFFIHVIKSVDHEVLSEKVCVFLTMVVVCKCRMFCKWNSVKIEILKKNPNFLFCNLNLSTLLISVLPDIRHNVKERNESSTRIYRIVLRDKTEIRGKSIPTLQRPCTWTKWCYL